MRRSRAECRCNDRTVEPTRYADENLIETCRPGADGMLECYSQRIRCFVEGLRSEEHTSELQSLMRISYAVFCLTKKKHQQIRIQRKRTIVVNTTRNRRL